MLTEEQMKKLGAEEFDAADFLKSEEACQAYLTEMLKTENAELIVYALGVVARAKGMMKISKNTGCSRTSLYKALSKNSRPEFKTIYNVMREFGIELTLKKPKKRKKELAPA